MLPKKKDVWSVQVLSVYEVHSIETNSRHAARESIFLDLELWKKFLMIHIYIEIDIDKCQPANNKGCVDKITIKENSSTVTRWMSNALRTLDNPYKLFPYCMLLLILVFILP